MPHALPCAKRPGHAVWGILRTAERTLRLSRLGTAGAGGRCRHHVEAVVAEGGGIGGVLGQQEVARAAVEVGEGNQVRVTLAVDVFQLFLQGFDVGLRGQA